MCRIYGVEFCDQSHLGHVTKRWGVTNQTVTFAPAFVKTQRVNCPHQRDEVALETIIPCHPRKLTDKLLRYGVFLLSVIVY